MSTPWHSHTVEEVLTKLNSRLGGLSSKEVEERLRTYGRNELVAKKKSPLELLLKQFTNFLIGILLVATLISFILGEVIDATAILIIVMIMAIMGFIQEYRAERTLEALKKLAAPTCKVLRDGEEKVIDASEVVPGDILLLSEGDRVAADARVIESINMDTDEASLTGESTPVAKLADITLPPDTIVGDRKNMVFMGTYVVRGKGKAVVTATGMNTEFGKITKMVVEAEEEKTPLEVELDEFGKRIGAIILGICGIVFVMTLFVEHTDVLDALMLAVALGVAAVPEGLPAIATAVLAVGARRMAAKNALVRKLAAVEGLGACNVICSDKTGTITKAEMTVKVIKMVNGTYEVSGSGFEPKGEIKVVNGNDNKDDVKFLLESLAVHTSPDVKLVFDGGQWKVLGSPTEGAALVLAYKGLGEENIKSVIEKYRVVKTFPFDRFRKRKTTVHEYGSKYLAISSGAPEMLLDISSKVRNNGNEEVLGIEVRKKIIDEITELASSGYRTFGIAYKLIDSIPEAVEDVERELTFASVLGIIDPPREGVKEAVDVCRRAGIKVVMVTGDHKLTAMAVGKMIGLDASEENVLEGRQLETMSDEEFAKIVDKIGVYARVTPEHKARIVKMLKNKGYRVAMTGDGVNDAPALKMADIGVAMGIKGTEVAKEASQLVLLDDNFVTIVEAVKEGRVIFENLKKPINYLLTCNLGEVATVFGAELLGLPPILRPIHLLWINVTTDALPAIALGFEPAEPGILEKPPRSAKERFITKRKLIYYIVMGTILGIMVILLFTSTLSRGLRFAQTVAFTTLVLSEFGRALASRSEQINVWRLPGNKWLLPALLTSLILQLLVIYTPISVAFSAVPLPLEMFMYMAVVPLIIVLVDEIRKIFKIRIT
ncbi:MAG: cation-translocating P-type ATPase [Sulfolobales archaeon]|nr:cation-translocating P-type ATPase [Sulfolobales archaeon]MCX8185881.1 cation-translocating P-type ATPase [Sulfolobales archaeon]